MANNSPGLFGLKNTNKDFSSPESWGKNQFNNTFPASLACYLASKRIEPIYLGMNGNAELVHSRISVETVFGSSPASDDLYFWFEGQFPPYAPLVIDGLEGVDLVLVNRNTNQQLQALEIKLTAIPDDVTSNFPLEKQGSEIVVRPQTISYLALSIASTYPSDEDRRYLNSVISPIAKEIPDWSDPYIVRRLIKEMVVALREICVNKVQKQKPLLLQTIWRTEGRILAENCFDIFVWSDFGFLNLFADFAISSTTQRVSRHARTVCWLAKMLYDYSVDGRFNPRKIQDELTYETRNDKAFAVSGSASNGLMKCEELITPRIQRKELKEIILGDGHKLLKPERRLDAAILGTPGLFE